MNILEQKSIINNIELIGVPEQPNENCKEVVELITFKLGAKTAVVNAFRTHSKSSNRPKKMNAILHSMENKKKCNGVCQINETECKYGKSKLG